MEDYWLLRGTSTWKEYRRQWQMDYEVLYTMYGDELASILLLLLYIHIYIYIYIYIYKYNKHYPID
jgi:hypothetical protein